MFKEFSMSGCPCCLITGVRLPASVFQGLQLSWLQFSSGWCSGRKSSTEVTATRNYKVCRRKGYLIYFHMFTSNSCLITTLILVLFGFSFHVYFSFWPVRPVPLGLLELKVSHMCPFRPMRAHEAFPFSNFVVLFLGSPNFRGPTGCFEHLLQAMLNVASFQCWQCAGSFVLVDTWWRSLLFGVEGAKGIMIDPQ